LGDQPDDNRDVTVVIALQVLVAALAGLLLLESRTNRHNEAISHSIDPDSSEMIEFHPELLARWDDEAAYAQPRPCARPRVRPSHAVQRADNAFAALRHLDN
jgi:hypothetical protein